MEVFKSNCHFVRVLIFQFDVARVRSWLPRVIFVMNYMCDVWINWRAMDIFVMFGENFWSSHATYSFYQGDFLIHA